MPARRASLPARKGGRHECPQPSLPSSKEAAPKQGAPFSPPRAVSLAGAVLEPPVLLSQEGEGPLEAFLLSLCWWWCGLSLFLAGWLLSVIVPHCCFGWACRCPWFGEGAHLVRPNREWEGELCVLRVQSSLGGRPGCRHHLNTSPFLIYFSVWFYEPAIQDLTSSPILLLLPQFFKCGPGEAEGEWWSVRGTALTPCTPSLLGQGCPRGARLLRQREESTRHHLQAGEWISHQGNGGKGAKHLPQRWPRGKECSTATQGSKSKEKREDGGGQRSPAIHSPLFWSWIGLLPLAAPRSPSLAAPGQEQGCHCLWGWQGERAGWRFPCGVPENLLFPHCVVTTISMCECVCAHVRVRGRVGG